jgi:hypothetical protein
VHNVTITGSLHPRMNFNWPDLSIIHKCTQMITRLKSVYAISYYKSYRLSEIIADSHYILLFTKTPDHVFNLVQLSGTTWKSIHPINFPRQNDDLKPLRHLPNLANYAHQHAPSYTEASMNILSNSFYPEI